MALCVFANGENVTRRLEALDTDRVSSSRLTPLPVAADDVESDAWLIQPLELLSIGRILLGQPPFFCELGPVTGINGSVRPNRTL